jgi:hypothetical protein
MPTEISASHAKRKLADNPSQAIAIQRVSPPSWLRPQEGKTP